MDRESHIDIRIEDGRTKGSVKCMAPKRRFWTAEQSVAYVFLNEFSISGSPKKVLSIEQYFKHAYATICSVFPNLRLGYIQFMLSKRRFWKIRNISEYVFDAIFNVW